MFCKISPAIKNDVIPFTLSLSCSTKAQKRGRQQPKRPPPSETLKTTIQVVLLKYHLSEKAYMIVEMGNGA